MSQNHIQLYYFHSALLQIFKSPPNDTVDKCYALLLEKGMESFQNNQSSKKKKSKSRLNLFEETVTDLPDPQSQSVVAASMKEINNILEPTIKGSTIRTEMIDPKLITVSEFKNAFYKIIQLEYPDDFMMRFIRARKYHLRKALDMMIKAIKFQIVFHVEKIRMIGDTKLPAKELSGKSFVYNSDQDGRPILYVNTAMHDKNGASYSEMEEVAVYIMETLRCFVRHPVSNIILVFNMTNFGVQNMDNGLTKFITACTQDYYPESLYKCFVVNAPWVFNSFWKIIKNWLDPVVQAKIEFVSDEELRKHLPHLPKILNPDSNFEYNYCPPKDIDYKFVDSRNKEEKQRYCLLI